MTKLTLDMATFKALASDTRLDILKSLDGKRMALKDICKATKLNKATLHEHLSKLNEAGLVKKKEREGHKWVFYKLTWKGECLLHPENTRIVVMFTTTFMVLAAGIIQLVTFAKGQVLTRLDSSYNFGINSHYGDSYSKETIDMINEVSKGGDRLANGLPSPGVVPQSTVSIIYNPMLQYIAIACITIFVVLLCFSIWRFRKNKNSKL